MKRITHAQLDSCRRRPRAAAAAAEAGARLRAPASSQTPRAAPTAEVQPRSRPAQPSFRPDELAAPPARPRRRRASCTCAVGQSSLSIGHTQREVESESRLLRSRRSVRAMIIATTPVSSSTTASELTSEIQCTWDVSWTCRGRVPQNGRAGPDQAPGRRPCRGIGPTATLTGRATPPR